MSWSALRMILLGALVIATIPAEAYGRPADSGTLTICNASSGARPATGVLAYTAAAPAAAGGSIVFNIAAGTCAPRVFYPLGAGVTVSEAVPPGDVVTGIKLTPTPGGGGTKSVISSSSLSPETATVTIGNGQATLTFTTSSATDGHGSPCKVPNVFGLRLAAAVTAIRKAHCTLGTLIKLYSDVFYPDRVMSQGVTPGTVLPPRAHVSLTVSLGPHR
jgi:PASTA domain-containing protein